MTQTRSKTKTATIVDQLNGKTGANLEALCKATSWQAHSVRAAISGLRKAGYEIERRPPGPSTKEKAGPVYKITGRPA